MNSERFANKKAEYYWGLRERFRAGEIGGLADETTISQLATIRYEQTPQGQIAIESKEEARKRGVKSPDRAENKKSISRLHAWDERGARRLDHRRDLAGVPRVGRIHSGRIRNSPYTGAGDGHPDLLVPDFGCGATKRIRVIITHWYEGLE